MTVSAATYEPFATHFIERDAVAFVVADTLDGDSARGDVGGHVEGVVRPMLKWTTDTGGQSK